MNVKELRLGNIIYIYWKNASGKSTAVINLGAIMDLATNGTGSAYYYEPIPLTEEWLLSFGAEKFEFDNGQPNQYRIGNRLFVLRKGYWTDYGSSVALQYVHQLQNLYFALTGQELEVQSV